MRIAILGNHLKPIFAPIVEQLFIELGQNRVQIYVCETFWSFIQQQCYIDPNTDIEIINKSESLSSFNAVISVGGDGTFLESALRVGDSGVPIVGINAGRLGFLADNSEDNLNELVNDLCQNNFRIEERTLLELVSPQDAFEFNFALNEIAILKNDNSSMITVHTYVDDQYVNSYWCDGLLTVTPTGSTAYSLSVGGPIMTPNSKSLIITPVAPHSLNVRPIVVSDDVELRLEVECRSDNFLLALDSRSIPMPLHTQLIIRKAKHTVRIIERKNNNYFNTLRSKLMWGADRRN